MNHSWEEKLNNSKTPSQVAEDIRILQVMLPNYEIIQKNTNGNDNGTDYFALSPSEEFILCVDIKHRGNGVSRFWNHGCAELTIEVTSNKEKGILGWALDDNKMSSDVVFTFDPTDDKNAYAVRASDLRHVAKKNLDKWISAYGLKSCTTDGQYTTESVYVPIDEVYDEIEKYRGKEIRKDCIRKVY